jgi:hypothetical protein
VFLLSPSSSCISLFAPIFCSIIDDHSISSSQIPFSLTDLLQSLYSGLPANVQCTTQVCLPFYKKIPKKYTNERCLFVNVLTFFGGPLLSEMVQIHTGRFIERTV